MVITLRLQVWNLSYPYTASANMFVNLLCSISFNAFCSHLRSYLEWTISATVSTYLFLIKKRDWSLVFLVQEPKLKSSQIIIYISRASLLVVCAEIVLDNQRTIGRTLTCHLSMFRLSRFHWVVGGSIHQRRFTSYIQNLQNYKTPKPQ